MPEAAMFSTFNVTTPADDLSLLTIEELRAAVGVTGTAEDAALKTLGLRLSASIARQCCIASDGINPATLMLETCTETFRAVRPPNELILARRPVTAIVSVSEHGAIIDPADYEIRRSAGILARLRGDRFSCFPTGKITVVYKAGFEDLPEDLKLAASKLALALYSETSRDPNLKRVSIPDVEEREYWVGPADDPLLSAEIQDLLAPYKQLFL
jgi:hypothetical protein